MAWSANAGAGARADVLRELERVTGKKWPVDKDVTKRADGRSGPVIPAAGREDVAKNGADSSRGPRAPEARERAGGTGAEAGAQTGTQEHRKTKPNRRENEFMLNLMVLRNTLKKNAPACRERAREAGKTVWRDIRLMERLVDKIQTAMLETMPDSRDDYYRAYAQHGHYEMRIDGPVRTSRHLLVTDKHLAAICEAAMRSECILCMREGSEVGGCQLREALLEAAPPGSVQDEGLYRKCEYRAAAGALIQGEDVMI